MIEAVDWEKALNEHLSRIVSLKPKKERIGLVAFPEDKAGWDSPSNELMNQYKKSINIISHKLGEPFYSGKGPMFTQFNQSLHPNTTNYLSLLYISCWKIDTMSVYLTVDHHDADSLRSLNLEILQD